MKNKKKRHTSTTTNASPCNTTGVGRHYHKLLKTDKGTKKCRRRRSKDRKIRTAPGFDKIPFNPYSKTKDQYHPHVKKFLREIFSESRRPPT